MKLFIWLTKKILSDTLSNNFVYKEEHNSLCTFSWIALIIIRSNLKIIKAELIFEFMLPKNATI